jgi:hypothetical protein
LHWPSPISIWPGAFRSPLSARPAGVFPLGSLRWLLGRLVGELNRRTRSERWQGFRLLAIDHTTLTLPETAPLWRRFRSHRGQHGLGPIAVEFACLFHLVSRAPFRFTLARSATSDHRLIQKLIPALKKGDLLLIDSGFYFLITVCLIRLAMLEAARRGKVTVAQLSFSRSLTQIRVFFRRLCRFPLPHWEHLYADLINACAAFLVRIKPGRSFSRDRQQYRRKARGLEPTRRGKKPVTTPVPSRPKPEVRYDHCLLP